MKSFSAILLACAAIIGTTMGVSVVVKDEQVYVDDKKVDLSKLQMIKDNDLYCTYELHSGESVITITKSKIGNALSVSSKGPMTAAEKKKMEEMQSKIGEEVDKNIQQVHDNIKTMNQELEASIANMNKQIKNMFKSNFNPF